MKPRPMSQPIRTKQSNRFPILESKFWDTSVPKSTEVFSGIWKKGSLKWCPLRLVAHFWVTNIGSSLDWLLIFEKPILAFPQIWEAVKHFGLRAQVYFLMILFVFLRKKLYFFRKLKEPPAARGERNVHRFLRSARPTCFGVPCCQNEAFGQFYGCGTFRTCLSLIFE